MCFKWEDSTVENRVLQGLHACLTTQCESVLRGTVLGEDLSGKRVLFTLGHLREVLSTTKGGMCERGVSCRDETGSHASWQILLKILLKLSACVTSPNNPVEQSCPPSSIHRWGPRNKGVAHLPKISKQ